MTAHVLPILRFAAHKTALLGAIFLLTATILFCAVRAVPGDPVAARLKNPDPERVAAERARLGLDDPLPVQWARYIGAFVRGEWGRSFTSGRTVRQDVAEFLPATLELALAGVALGVVLGAALAVLSEILRIGALRRMAAALGTIGLTVPVYWVGLLALVVGSLWLGWFPSSGRLDVAIAPPPVRTGLLTVDALVAGRGRALLDALRHLALPALCLSVFQAANVCAVLQARLRDVRLQTLVTALRARGYSPMRIWCGHVLRVVSAPVIAVIGTNFGMLLGGAALTETVFSWPGVGRWLVGAVIVRDIYVLENALLLIVLLVVVVVFASDLLARVINPVAARAGGEAETEERG